MEVTPEVYAWMISLNIIDGYKSMKVKSDGNVILSDSFTEKLLKGSYVDKILICLEEGYNKFYKVKLSYTDKLKDMKSLKDDQQVSNSVRFHNWKIIADVLINFGIEIEEEKISKISIGNKSILTNLLKNVYMLSSEVMKRSFEMHGSKDNSKSTITVTNLSIKKEKDLNKKNVSNTSSSDSIDINNLNVNKSYKDCESPLEFFIVSLCKALEMKPKQAVALLSNNRKYLIHICNKGIKGDYEKIKNWYDDLSVNSRALTNLLKIWKDGKSVGLATLSVGLFSKNYKIAQFSFNLINQLQGDIGGDWDWFTKEGLDTLIFAINKHSQLRVQIINLIHEFSNGKHDELIQCLNSKLSDKDKLFEFLNSIISYIPDVNYHIKIKLKTFLLENLIKDNNDKSASISLLSDYLILFAPVEKNTTNVILNYIKKGVREKGKRSVQLSGVAHFFRLVKHYGERKDQSAPPIYKTLVFLFLENYDDKILRENFLQHFCIFFKSDSSIPINLLMDPYFRQLKSSKNFSLSDFQFISSLVEHPRLQQENVRDIIDFIFNASLIDIFYARISNLIFHVLVEKNLLTDESLFPICIDYIKNSLKFFTESLKTNNLQLALLETPYDIVSLEIPQINSNIHEEVKMAVEIYRGLANNHSSGLLALLYSFEDHDEVLLGLEEKFRIIYEPVELMLEKQKKKKEHEFKQTPGYVLEKIRKKKIDEVVNKREATLAQKAREEKIRKTLDKQLEKKSFEHGTLNWSNMNNSNLINENKTLILKEGSILENSKKRETSTTIFTHRNIQIILLDEEEDRERKAINGFIKQYKKQLNLSFNCYLTQVDNTVTKANILKFLRDLGITNDQFCLEDLTLTIRNLFGTPLNTFDKDQFINLILHSSYLIFNKISSNDNDKILGKYSISETFENFLNLIKVPVREKDNDIKENLKIIKALKDIFRQSEIEESSDLPQNFLNEQENENLDEDKTSPIIKKAKKDILLPPGFKKINKTIVNFDHKIPLNFLKFLPESKLIGIEVLNEIIFKITGSNIIEPIVKINKEPDIIFDTIDPNYKRWSMSVSLAYAGMDKSLEKESKEVCDLMEDMLKALDKGRTSLEKLKITPPLEKLEQESYSRFIEEEKNKDKARKLRTQMVKKKLDEMKQKKEEDEKKRDEELKKIKSEKEEKLKKQLLEDREMRKQMKDKIIQSQKQKEEEKTNKEKLEKEKKDENLKKKEAEKSKFLKKQKRKLKEQFTTIKNVKNEFIKKQNEVIQAGYKLPEVNIKKVLEKDKSYIEFEKNLNDMLDEMMKKPPISDVFAKYENHIKVIYDIYYKIGSKLNRYLDEFMFINEFKEFCLNFTVLGLLINNEQMIYIFRKVCKRNEWGKEEKLYFNYSDFILSLFYISICSKFTHRARKILPSDIEGVDDKMVQSFFDFLGLKIPFNKREVEDFINDRRALSAKQLSRLQQKIKKEKINMVKNEEEKESSLNAQKSKRLLNNNFILKHKEGSNVNEKEKKFADVDINKLKDTKIDQTKIFNPSGNPENWQVKK